MSNEIAKVQITDTVLSKVNSLQEANELHLPQNFSAANSLKAAWIVLNETTNKDGKHALQVCTQESIAMSLFEMVTKGLSVAKKQCYFVVYGNQLQFVPSYHGNVLIAKRTANVKDVAGQVVYEGDDFEYGIDTTTGRKKIIKHVQKLENIDNNKIVGAYAIVTFEDGSTKAEIMPMVQIRQSWMQGATKGNSPAHKNFPDQMAIRTVINRALKLENSSADDSHLSIDDDGSTSEATSTAKIETKVEAVDFEEAQVVDEKKESTPETVETKQPDAPKQEQSSIPNF